MFLKPRAKAATLLSTHHRPPPPSFLSCSLSAVSVLFMISGLEAIISENILILNTTHGGRYRIIHDRDTQFDLEIRDLLLTDAGGYRCKDANDRLPNLFFRQAALIVLGKCFILVKLFL